MFPVEKLERLKKAYAKLDKINPSSEAYTRIKNYVCDMDDEKLQQLIEYKIKVISYIAFTEYKRRQTITQVYEALNDIL